MMSSQFSLLLRSSMTLAGAGGFVLGAGLASFYGQNTLAMSLVKGAVLCLVATFLTRFLLMMMFRAYLHQLQVRRQEEENKTK